MCEFADRCETASTRLRARKTVAEAIADQPQVDLSVIIAADDLAAYAVDLWTKAGGGYPWWMSAAKTSVKLRKKRRTFIEVMDGVIKACAATKWDARTYVRAQVDSLSDCIKRGYSLQPGYFHGQNADGRFERWVHRKQQRVGVVRVDPRLTEVQQYEKMRAATCEYAMVRIVGGAPHAVARDAARGIYDEWHSSKVTERLQLEALSHVLATIDPSLPHMLLLPDEPWSWKQAVEAVSSLVNQANDESNHDEPSIDGEFL